MTTLQSKVSSFPQVFDLQRKLNCDFIVGLIVMIGIFCLFFYSYKGNQKENFANGSSNVTFMSKEDLKTKLLNEKDSYYQSFSMYDLEARSAKSIEDYLSKVEKSISEFSDSQKRRLEKLSQDADQRIQKIQKSWLNGNILKNMKWKFGLTTGGNYEGGLPHTRHDYIMLSDSLLQNDDKYITGTLIHEKVHLYQRRYPESVEKYKDENGMRKWKRKSANDRVRANPDVDEYLYKTKDGEPMMSVYNENPKGLEDVKTYPQEGQKNEHPHERMAIQIEEMVI